MSAGALSGIDALGRGVSSLRANWELILVATGGTLVVALVALAGLAPAVALVGLSLVDLLGAAAGASTSAALALRDLDPAALGGAALIAAALAFVGALLVASLVQCWVQAGILGTLWTADAQAPPGPRRPALSFRTFSPRLFAAEARRNFLRLLGFYGVVLAFGIVWTLLAAGLVAGAVAAGQGLDGIAGVAIGCGGAIPLLCALVILVLGVAVGQADVPRPESSALGAVETGFRVLGRRLGACALLYLIFIAVAVAVATVEGLTSFTSSLLLADAPAAGLTVGILLFVAQTLVQTALTLGLTAGLVALVRAEAARGEIAA